MPVNQEIETTVHSAAPPFANMMSLLFGKHITYALSAVARLGVADYMNERPVSIERLAAQSGAHAPTLYRVMRTLASVGVFNESEDKKFSLTPEGRLLKAGAPESLRSFAIQMGDEWSTRPWEHFSATVRSGEDGVTKAYGKNVFEVLGEMPEEAATFNQSMTAFSAIVGEAILEAYDFSAIRRLADIGGGHGLLLASILKQYPGMRGVLYDLPEVAAGAFAQAHFDSCRGRLEVESGSFFERVPAGCDAYIMKMIVHDWSNDGCRKILACIREQLPSDGRVIVCEQIVGAEEGPSFAKLLDMEMLALTVGGKERTVEEFRQLFTSAGLRLTNVIPTKGPVFLLEARPS